MPRRTRIKIPGQRGKPAYFAQIAQRLRECPGVTDVQVNPRTASLLVEHTVPFGEVAAFAKARNLFSVEAAEVFRAQVEQRITGQLAWLDEEITRLSRGNLDLRIVLVISLLMLIAIQISRGRILEPASKLLWYVTDLLDIRLPS